MTDLSGRDPVETAADVAGLIAVKDGFPQNEAIIRFMRSSTFHRILDEPDIASMNPDVLLDMDHKEIGE